MVRTHSRFYENFTAQQRAALLRSIKASGRTPETVAFEVDVQIEKLKVVRAALRAKRNGK